MFQIYSVELAASSLMASTIASRSSFFMSFVRRKYIYAAASANSFFTTSKHTAVRRGAEVNSASRSADVQFTVFYRFPHITTARFISRLKLYQTAVVVLAVPPTVYSYSIGAVELGLCAGVTGASVLALIMLYIAANFFQRVVGLVALSSDQKLVRLSHLTFFGRRNDIIVPVDDIVPISDVGQRTNDVLVKVYRYSTTDKLYMSLLYGHIENRETFQKVFGIID